MPKEVSPGEREMAQSRALRPQRAFRPKTLPFPLAVKQTEAQSGEETYLLKVTQPMGCKAGHGLSGACGTPGSQTTSSPLIHNPDCWALLSSLVREVPMSHS